TVGPRVLVVVARVLAKDVPRARGTRDEIEGALAERHADDRAPARPRVEERTQGVAPQAEKRRRYLQAARPWRECTHAASPTARRSVPNRTCSWSAQPASGRPATRAGRTQRVSQMGGLTSLTSPRTVADGTRSRSSAGPSWRTRPSPSSSPRGARP